MFKKIFGGGWKVITGSVLKFVVPVVIATAPPQVISGAQAIGAALIVIGAGHKLEKVGREIIAATGGQTQEGK